MPQAGMLISLGIAVRETQENGVAGVVGLYAFENNVFDLASVDDCHLPAATFDSTLACDSDIVLSNGEEQ